MNQIIKQWIHYILLLFALSIPQYEGTHAMEENENKEDEYFVCIQFEVKKNKEKKYHNFFVSLQATPTLFFDKIVTLLKKRGAITQEEEITNVNIFSKITQKNGNTNKNSIEIKPENFKKEIMTLIGLDKEINNKMSQKDESTKFVQYRADKLEEDQLNGYHSMYSGFVVVTSKNELKPFCTLFSANDFEGKFVEFMFVTEEAQEAYIFLTEVLSTPLYLMKVLSEKLGTEVTETNSIAWENSLKEKLDIQNSTLEYLSGPNRDIQTVVLDNLSMFFESHENIEAMLKKKYNYSSEGEKFYTRAEVLSAITNNRLTGLYRNDNTSIISKSATLKKDEFIDVFNTEKVTCGTDTKDGTHNKALEAKTDRKTGIENIDENDQEQIDKQNDNTLDAQDDTTKLSQNDETKKTENNNDISRSPTQKIGITSGVIMIIIGIIGSLLYYIKQSKTGSSSTENRKYDDKESTI